MLKPGYFGNAFYDEIVRRQSSRFIEATNVYFTGKGNSEWFRAKYTQFLQCN
jgi:hypothetical protein